MKKEKIIVIIASLISALFTAVIVLIADTPNKIYANPMVGDIIVLIAATFLLIDSFKYINHRRFYSTVLRVLIGASMITVHLMQFLLDWSKGFL